MKVKLYIIKKVIDMEHPGRNTNEEKTILVDENEPFEEDGDHAIFKIISVKPDRIVLEYDHHYLVKNEHRGYEFETTFNLEETKEITSQWGKHQKTYKITFLGIED
ncbi:MAG TPA: hypothetical protein PKK56_00665 [archaeon]|jgi:hypothetical protein|nr:hypothetical protein [archaeon]HPC10337.1 hypothetical protein [archaeon]HRT03902.1 hypothetical protein [Candidatus Diapherotrites archaeon]